MVKLHDLLVSFPEDQRIEPVDIVDFADFFEDLELSSHIGTFRSVDYASTCLNKILIISGLTTKFNLALSYTSLVSTNMYSLSIILRHSWGMVDSSIYKLL